ncbi:hypothetical protein [Pseudoxanthomonas sp.]|uniref:hypothetical protein n=1 Tax=Pseudoxanthomonas sp. TaxID=1871049 RepID=UPI00258549D3|nr:hypothetical protein [Pseudoxanthomonas sp.]MCR6686684.1 hypothetical protein [Pseudoxanthomonas sp.]
MGMMRVLTIEEMGQVSGGYYQLIADSLWDEKDAPGTPGPGGPGGPAPGPGGGGIPAPGTPSPEEIREVARKIAEEREGSITWKVYGKHTEEQEVGGKTTKKTEIGFEIGGKF